MAIAGRRGRRVIAGHIARSRDRSRAGLGAAAAVRGAGAGVASWQASAGVVRRLAEQQERAVAGAEEVGAARVLDDGFAFDRDQGRVPLADADFDGAGPGHAGDPAATAHLEQCFVRNDVVRTGFEEEGEPIIGGGEAERRAGFEPDAHLAADSDPGWSVGFDALAGVGRGGGHTIDGHGACGSRDPGRLAGRAPLVVEVLGRGDNRGGDARADGDGDPALAGDAGWRAAGRLLDAEFGEDAEPERLAAFGRKRAGSGAVERLLDIAELEGVIGFTA